MYSTADDTRATLPVYLLRCLAAIANEFDIDPDRLCLGLGFDVADLSNPQCRVSFRQASSMIRRAVEMTRGRDLGLKLGTSSTIASFGLAGYAMLTSPTFGEAVALGIKLQAHAGSLLQLDLQRNQSTLSVRASLCYEAPEIETFLVEDAFGSFLRIGQSLVGTAFIPSRLELGYGPPGYAPTYERVFKCPVHFNRREHVFSFDAQWARRRIPTWDPLSHRQALDFLQIKARQDPPEADFIESIERIIRRDLRHAPSLTAMATLLCVSDRTLRRRLAGSRLSYQAVLDNARKKRALVLLSNPQHSINEIAYEVGFADSRNFRRAFKRWTGCGPREYRR